MVPQECWVLGDAVSAKGSERRARPATQDAGSGADHERDRDDKRRRQKGIRAERVRRCLTCDGLSLKVLS